MSKKRSRIVNSQPFSPFSSDSVYSKRRSKPPKDHLLEQRLVPSAVSPKILNEALNQQKEIQREEEIKEAQNNGFEFSQVDDPKNSIRDGGEEDLDDFRGFSEKEIVSWHSDFEDKIDEEDEKLLEAFLSKDDRPNRTLADIIVEKIKNQDTLVSSGALSVPKLDDSIVELYKGVGKLLSKYTSGKVPKAFKHIPSLQFLEEVLYLTEPEKWSPNAMLKATKIFASNLGVKKVERFYKFVLLPRVREDIRKNKRLHFDLYQSLKEALFKPAAFNKGILFPLCESKTCSLREAVIVGSIIQKNSIPSLDSSVALLKLAKLEYCGTTRAMPVIWHQSLLAFAQRYKNELTKEDKANLNTLVDKQRHKLVTPEILRELNNSRNRGDREDLMSIYILSPLKYEFLIIFCFSYCGISAI